MFGISLAEFVIIVIVAVLVIPCRMWPDVARFIARAVKFIRGIVWKITDASERIKTQIELEKPIDDLIKTTTDDILADFSTDNNVVKKTAGTKKRVMKKHKMAGRKK